MNLRQQLDVIMPGWDRWYGSVFDAACDLGLIRARVCAPSSLLLANRHAGVTSEAVRAFREKWTVEDDPLEPGQPLSGDALSAEASPGDPLDPDS